MIMSLRRHPRDGLIVIIRTITRVAHDYTLLLSKLLLLSSCNAPDNIILLGYRLWHIGTTAWLTRCLWSAMTDHLCHVIGRELSRSTTILYKHLWWPHCDYSVDKLGDPVGIWQLPTTSEALSYSVLHL